MPIDPVPTDAEIRILAAANLQAMANHNNDEAVKKYGLVSDSWTAARHLEIWNKWTPYSSAGPLPPPPRRLAVVWKIIEGYEGLYPILVSTQDEACPPVAEVTEAPSHLAPGLAAVGVHLYGPIWQCQLNDTMPEGAEVPAGTDHPKVKKIPTFAGFLYQEVQ